MSLEYRIYEDVVALDETTALLTVGSMLATLNRVLLVNYVETKEGKLEFTPTKKLIEGAYIRLGNVADGFVYFSEGNPLHSTGASEVKKLNLLTDEITIVMTGPENPHQPFFNLDKKLYYTGDAPRARIYCNGNVFIENDDDFRECGNPFIYNNFMYFECLPHNMAHRPQGWVIYRMNLTTHEKEFVIKGANPSLYNGFLYYDVYQAGSSSFLAYRVKLEDLKLNIGT